MDITRRKLLHLAGVLGATTVAANTEGCGPTNAPGDGAVDGTGDGGDPDAMDASVDVADVPQDVPWDLPPDPTGPFRHGVASGDPLSDRVILWTRVTPEMPGAMSVDVTWQVATDPAFMNVVQSGMATTTAMRDFTVKVDAMGLMPATTYYYRFAGAGTMSPIGRTRTTPSGATSRLRFAVVACASYAHGFFHGYREVSRRADLDAVIHLGDYIYEYPNAEYGNIRMYDPPTEIFTLEDYRRRYAHYRKDRDLQEAHRQHPFITIWDDHEFADNSWRDGALNHQAGEGMWSARRAAATQAYFEWMPIRDSMDNRVFRRVRFGDLLDLILLDTRIWGREEPTSSLRDARVMDPNRQLLGADQEMWLATQLMDAGTRWRLIGQQVVLGRLAPDLPNPDQWDGYLSARRRFFDMLASTSSRDVVVLTGDIHSSWALDLAPDGAMYDRATGAGAVAVEFVVPGISSPGFPSGIAAGLQAGLMANLGHLKWTDLTRRGYAVLDVTRDRIQSAWFLFDRVETPVPQMQRFAAAYSTQRGMPRLRADMAAADPPAMSPPLAP